MSGSATCTAALDLRARRQQGDESGGSHWAALGRLWVIWGHSGGTLGVTLGRLGPRLSDLGTLQGYFGGHFGSPWGAFWRSGDTLGAVWGITRFRDPIFRVNVAEPPCLSTKYGHRHPGTRPRNPRIPRNPRKWCHDPLLRTSLPHAPGVKMT